ncbi:MAG: NUDIX domain-containing protein, partial [Chitinophagia bacterium]|nr:NUDIX domain-containing protein [Chitinophagia bacterium]
QQRASCKYHSAGKWSNTCCSHPREGETVYAAARRRLAEEMKLDCELSHAFSFLYRADMGNKLIEHEYDHVFIGVTDALPEPNPKEVGDWKYISEEELFYELDHQPAKYTEWLKICLQKHNQQLFHRI